VTITPYSSQKLGISDVKNYTRTIKTENGRLDSNMADILNPKLNLTLLERTVQELSQDIRHMEKCQIKKTRERKNE